MKKHIRPLALLACISAATAFGSQLAFADGGAGTAGSKANCSDQQGRHGRHEFRRGGFLKKLAKELGMTEQQKSQAKAIMEANRAQNKQLFSAMMNERHQLRSMVMSGSADEAAIRAQSGKVAAIQADLAVKRSQEARQLRALLTPDQLTKLQGIMEKREQKFREHQSRHEQRGMEF